MAIIDIDNGISILTDPEEDLKSEEMARKISDQQQDIFKDIIQQCCCEAPPCYPSCYNGPIFGCGCCGYDPRK